MLTEQNAVSAMRGITLARHRFLPVLPRRGSRVLARSRQERPGGEDSSPGNRRHDGRPDFLSNDNQPVFNIDACGEACSLGTAKDAWNACVMHDGDAKDECYANFGADAFRVEKYLDDVTELEKALKLPAANSELELHSLLGNSSMPDAAIGMLLLMGFGLLVLPFTIVQGGWKICTHLLKAASQRSPDIESGAIKHPNMDGQSELFIFSENEKCFKKLMAIQEYQPISTVPPKYLEDEGL